MFLAQSVSVSDATKALRAANEARDIVLLFIAILVAFAVIYLLSKGRDKADERSDGNIGKLIEFSGQLTQLNVAQTGKLEEQEKAREEELRLIEKMIETLKGIDSNFAISQKNVIDHQVLIDGSLALLRGEFEAFGNNIRDKLGGVSESIEEVLVIVHDEPERHGEIKERLDEILSAIKDCRETGLGETEGVQSTG